MAAPSSSIATRLAADGGPVIAQLDEFEVTLDELQHRGEVASGEEGNDALVVRRVRCWGSRKREALKLSATLLRLATKVVSIIESVSKAVRRLGRDIRSGGDGRASWNRD